jgi:hypothetical protein
LITFVFEEINRFFSQDKQPDNFDALFGCPHWHEGVGIAASRSASSFFMTYISVNSRKLLNSCARSQMSKRDTMDYFLFFATNNELGLKKMKDAMWRVDESGTQPCPGLAAEQIAPPEPNGALPSSLEFKMGGAHNGTGGGDDHVVQSSLDRKYD